MASSRALLIVAMLAAAACAANAACEPGDDFDRRTGKQCEQPQKRRSESVCPSDHTLDNLAHRLLRHVFPQPRLHRTIATAHKTARKTLGSPCCTFSVA